MNRSSHVLMPFVAILLAGGCAVGPAYEPPATDVGPWIASPAVAEAGARPDEGEVVERWWSLFDDPLLDELIDAAAAANRDLAAAEARVRAARAARGAAAATLFPTLAGQAEGARQQVSELAPGGLPELAEAGLASLTQDSWTVGFDARFEVDLFGGNRAGVAAAEARLAAREDELRGVRLSVLGEVARNYFELRGLQRQLVVLESRVAIQAERLALIEQLVAIGLEAELTAARTRTALQRTRATEPELRAAIRAGAYRLAVLTGQAPAALVDRLAAAAPLPAEPDVIPVGLRSDLLRRRPDLRAAERQLAAETADVRVAIAERFPSFQLTARPGFQAQTIGDVFEQAAETWTVAGLLGWPLFRGGALAAGVDAARAEADEARARYEQAVLLALEDVEAGLQRYGEALRSRAELLAAEAAAQRALALARGLAEQGLAARLEVLDAERELRTVQDALAAAETRALVFLVAVYKALGGGWEPFEATASA